MPEFTARDISWLSFNARVLQEAADPNVPLPLRIRFLGIFSNNLDEFFRVRVAGLKRAMEMKAKITAESFFEEPQKILNTINKLVIQQQEDFNNIWRNIQKEMVDENIFICTPADLSFQQRSFIRKYFDEKVESNIIPILLEEDRSMPFLRDKSLYIGIAMWNKNSKKNKRFAIIEVPSVELGRFVLLPSTHGETNVILLEDVIIENLPHIFSYFGYEEFSAHCFKVTKDAEFDLDNDVKTSFVEKIEKGLKNRRKGKPTRFVFDRHIDKSLLDFLIKKLNLNKRDSMIPGDKIHNFKNFMDFPDVFENPSPRERTSFNHPDFNQHTRVTDVILKKDVLLSFPYHSFTAVIDLLREAAMDPDVTTIHITAYRLASHSKIANALINAVRNGKQVTVMLELRARFDEEANIYWKEKLEEEGVRILVGIPDKKVHAKLCVIKKRVHNKMTQYGFVSTGNFNEKTAKIYGDHMLMTSDKSIMADINRIFSLLKKPKQDPLSALAKCKTLLVCPQHMRDKIMSYIDKEIEEAKAGHKAEIIVKVNSLSDKDLIKKLYEAAKAGVSIKMIVRGIYCAVNQKTFKKKIHTVSIVDEYLEHSRIMYFYQGGKELMYLSSADWMTRNLDYRIEAAVKINNKILRKELKDILDIQLRDNVKARNLGTHLKNEYYTDDKKPFRSQIETYNYLKQKVKNEISSY
ncbi:polyphosphate kinase 1 [Elizabethkingia argentiflava]|uniref:Polyphosphate kinase n=1 Tax=Elizabethkingia argenteiflava TaxID=2681556 RepID=A0A845PWE2_9FLAO|nr:polyphosphate kinase 1 [Elizabethkingia argenteiflava]NAW51186.1 polyphosphate kinase 1 [Elizabethkingia argenteiflava]